MKTSRVRYLLFLVFAACLTTSANASVLLYLQHNPATTAGGGATSTRSGNGTWHLYALDTSNTDFGISSYNITLSGTTAINHRSPRTTINDGNGDPQTAGFSLLRTATNVNPIQASQGLPGSTPFPITGFGQTASDFITKATAIDAGAAVVGPTTSGTWGNYSSPVLNFVANPTGHKWMFIAEGTGPSYATAVTSAVFTVYTNSSATVSASTPVSSVFYIDDPEPASAMLLLTGLLLANFSRRQRSRRTV